jgi:hypothetical protein
MFAFDESERSESGPHAKGAVNTLAALKSRQVTLANSNCPNLARS